ncbi:hypothetical protein HBB16_04910 [Pseudonocardia sp. MCCB 268]|nr:hypothetical protein [Pseudonocardia cytotoxica]
MTVDTGGTFTDVVVADDSGTFHRWARPSPTTPASSPASGGPRGRSEQHAAPLGRCCPKRDMFAFTPPPVPRTRS